MDNYHPFNWEGKWLVATETPFIPVEGGFLVIPSPTETHANKVRSSAIMGAEDLYPETWGEVVLPVYMSDWNSCDMIADCLLNNQDFLDALGQALGERQRNQEDARSPNSSRNREEGRIETNSLDECWGGCLEATKHVFEVILMLLNYADNFADIADVLNSLPATSKPTPYSIPPATNPPSVPQLPYPVVDVASSGSVIIQGNPDDITVMKDNRRTNDQLGGLTQAQKLSWFTAVFEAGITLAKGWFSVENNLEYVAGFLFNVITCSPTGRKPDGEIFVFNNEALLDWSDALILTLDPFVSLCGVAVLIDGAIGEFFSVLKINELYRQYSLGLYAPSGTWNIIVDDCPTTPPELCGFDYELQFAPTVFDGFTMTQRVPFEAEPATIPIIPLQWQRPTPAPIANQFRELTIEADNTCNGAVSMEWARGTTNSAVAGILAEIDGVWQSVAGQTIPIGGAPNIPISLSWSNPSGLTYTRLRYFVRTPIPYLIRLGAQN